MCTMLHCDHMATFSAVLIVEPVVLPFGKLRNMSYSFRKIDFIALYRSSSCRNIF